MMIIQLIRDIETFAPTLEIGKIDRGKYTKWMIRMFPANEFVAEFNDFAKHPHTTTPMTTQAAYISSGLPLSIMKETSIRLPAKQAR